MHSKPWCATPGAIRTKRLRAESRTSRRKRAGLPSCCALPTGTPEIDVALATHGNLLALALNGLDPSFGYEFWRRLSFPDVYGLTLDGRRLIGVERIWDSD